MIEAVVMPAFNRKEKLILELKGILGINIYGENDDSGSAVRDDTEKFIFCIEYRDKDGSYDVLQITGDSAFAMGDFYWEFATLVSESRDEAAWDDGTEPEEVLMAWDENNRPLRYVN